MAAAGTPSPAKGGLWELIRKQFTVQKLLFHVLFWVFHWGIFAYGW
jgi:NADPH oxidase